LAERGARVVVNDVDDAPASDVVTEIAAAGGVAIADTSDVSTVDGAGALVTTSVDAFGRVDVVINNAGIIRWAGFPDADADNLAAHLAVHVGGSFNVTRAAWPHMVTEGYGRVVMTTSSGLFGLPNNTSYATAKAGVIGLTRSLSLAGASHGIKVNAIAPAAFTRMAGRGEATAEMAPEHVAPMAAYLAHEACPVTGEVYAAGFGRFSRIFVATTGGYVDPSATVEDVAAHWDEINDESGYDVPRDLMAWSAAFASHLPR
jgi:NAD(P)-dependent dehydrogenase (short-subunit alcohol dehydrogenase family)